VGQRDSAECLNGEMGGMDDLFAEINSFSAEDSDFSVGSVSADDNNPEEDFSYSFVSEGSDIEENELDNEAALLNFAVKLNRGLETYLEQQRRPSHYNIIGKKAPRTKQRHKAEELKKTKALHAQGYLDISSYFDGNGGDSELSDIEFMGTGFREEEEEEEEVEIIEQAQRVHCMRKEEEEDTDDDLEVSYQNTSIQSFPCHESTHLERDILLQTKRRQLKCIQLSNHLHPHQNFLPRVLQ